LSGVSLTAQATRIRALNVRAPFAQFILSGEKRYECRSYPTAHRGPLVIVSSVTRPARAQLSRLGVTPQEAESYLYGYAIGLVDVVNVREGRRGDEPLAFCDTRGAFVWIVANPRPIQPFRVAGRCGLYSLDAAQISPVGAAQARQ
jgi:ASCH domain